MSNISKEALLKSFPEAMNGTQAMSMLASVIAEELMTLYNENDLLLIYSQIDKLDSEMLDILAYDFKIDWWDGEATVETKRELFKSSFAVHRKLGTVGSVKRAITAEYEGAVVQEWFEYDGDPYTYRLIIDMGEKLYSSDVFHSILRRASYYTNVRSHMESVQFNSKRGTKMYAGCAISQGVIVTYNVAGPEEE